MASKVNEIDYGGDVKYADDYLASNQTLPQNTSEDGDEGSVSNIGKTQGSCEVAIIVTTAITLATAETLTIELYDSADDVTFTAFATVFTETASGEVTHAVDAVLARYVVPKTILQYVKAYITSTDAALTGAIDVYLNYLAR